MNSIKGENKNSKKNEKTVLITKSTSNQREKSKIKTIARQAKIMN